jgi:hypothetical protein
MLIFWGTGFDGFLISPNPVEERDRPVKLVLWALAFCKNMFFKSSLINGIPLI